jgi:hypothetical protein
MKILLDKIEGLKLEDRLIVGLDFGTTFSGIAYAFTDKDKAEIVPIVDWPGK